MQPHVFETMPRPRIKRAALRFFPGETVVSKTSGQRVKVLGMSDCGCWFEGVFIGHVGRGEAPAQHRYTYNAWRTSNFEKESA